MALLNYYNKWILQKLFTLNIVVITIFYCLILSVELTKGVTGFAKLTSVFIYRLDSLLLISTFVSTLFQLTSMQKTRIFNLLKIFGFSYQKIYLPFFLTCLIATSIVLLNNEYGLSFAHKHIKKNKVSSLFVNTPIYTNILPDNSQIYFQIEGDKIFDFYLVKSKNEIWHTNTLEILNQKIFAKEVDIFKRDKDSIFTLEKADNLDLSETLQIPKIKKLTKHRGISTLYSILFDKTTCKINYPFARANFYYRISIPFVPFIFLAFLILTLPTRHASLFKWHLSSIMFFCFIHFFFYLNLVLGENGKINPFLFFIICPLIFGGILYERCINKLQTN